MGNSDRFQSANDGAVDQKAAKVGADVLHEAVHDAFGPNALAGAGDRAANAALGNLSFSVNPMPKELILEPYSTLATAGTAGAVFDATALKSAKDFVASKPNIVFSDYITVSSSNSRINDVLKTHSNFSHGAKDFRAAIQSAASADTALMATNAELKTIAQTYKTPFAELPGVSPALARDRHMFFNGSAVAKVGYLGTSAKDFIGTAEDLTSGKKLFLEGSKEAGVLNALESGRKLQLRSGLDLQESLGALKRDARQVLNAEVKIANATYVEAGFKGFAKGALTSAASLGAAYAADSLLGNGSTLDSTPRSLLDGVAVPAVIMSELPARYKVGLASAAFLTSRVLGYVDSRNVTLRAEQHNFHPVLNLDHSSSMQKLLEKHK